MNPDGGQTMKHVLIVEDEEGLLEGLAHNFRYEGYEVMTARTGPEGLKAALKQKTAYEMRISDWSSDVCSSDLKSIFEKFVRIETGLVHDVKGAGLGLSLVEQIMRAHGGRIELKSALGEGSKIGRASCRERVYVLV